MPIVTVKAPEGVALRVRLQEKTEKPSVITEQGFDEHGNPTMVQKFGPKVTLWPDQSTDLVASESKDYEVSATQRIVVEQV